ncbi:carbon-nitrogen family hydrolase [Salirhabdus salicampi]|uniref:carbon-nitrogen family hydrolase n=1 Tax=Salirhabdus salicampi TaxID=476102 RepID=UPI0020C2A2D5|nr:carbon-nitrogen family hydrolase [Salirhabdus salicampi]MCP8615817.1 carbon-nitrogen family hydrolase [Salirhabdus salicampi]
MKLSVSLLQMDIVFGKPEENRKKVQDFVKQAMRDKPDVIVLPELWDTGYDLTRLQDIGDVDGKEGMALLSSLAKQYNVNIVGGSIAKRTDEGTTNTTFVFDRQGNNVGEYSKVHLFRLMDEEKYLVPGESTGFFHIDEVSCANFICYDIRFPEWVRLHAAKGAHVLFVTAEWPKPRVEHWRSLLISRAIENQSYVIACNRVGHDPNNEFGGHSMIISPWGEIVVEGDTSETILNGTIDVQDVEHVRKTIPIFEDRLPSLYEKYEKN